MKILAWNVCGNRHGAQNAGLDKVSDRESGILQRIIKEDPNPDIIILSEFGTETGDDKYRPPNCLNGKIIKDGLKVQYGQPIKHCFQDVSSFESSITVRIFAKNELKEDIVPIDHKDGEPELTGRWQEIKVCITGVDLHIIGVHIPDEENWKEEYDNYWKHINDNYTKSDKNIVLIGDFNGFPCWDDISDPQRRVGIKHDVNLRNLLEEGWADAWVAYSNQEQKDRFTTRGRDYENRIDHAFLSPRLAKLYKGRIKAYHDSSVRKGDNPLSDHSIIIVELEDPQ